MLEDLPIKSKEVLVVCSDATAVYSGMGQENLVELVSGIRSFLKLRALWLCVAFTP